MRPNTKVTAGALAGAFTVILVWAVQAFAEIEIPAEVAASLTVVFTFVASYFTPSGSTP